MKWFRRNRRPTIGELETRRKRAAGTEQLAKGIADKIEPNLRTLEVRKPRNGVYELVLDSISAPPREAH